MLTDYYVGIPVDRKVKYMSKKASPFYRIFTIYNPSTPVSTAAIPQQLSKAVFRVPVDHGQSLGLP
jgi:hypothetical protein